MTTGSIRRVLKELQQNEANTEPDDVRFYPINEDCTEFRGEFVGPPDTPYEGGKFQLEMKVPENYPFRPPKVRFITKIWHPNISSVTGYICLDILGNAWAPALTLRAVLISVQSMLTDAQISSPQDHVVAAQFSSNQSAYLATARHWTNVYAGGPHAVADCDSKIERLKMLGIDEEVARVELSKVNWDVEVALSSQFK